MTTYEAANGKWEIIYDHYGLGWKTGNKHRECPLCKTKNFRITDIHQNGEWICTCGRGNGFDLLKEFTGQQFSDVAKQVDKILGRTYDPDYKPKVNTKLEETKKLWNQSIAIKDSDAREYLYSRGCFELPTGGIKYSDRIYDHEYKKFMSGIIAIASDEFGKPIKRHVTYIENGKKALVREAKKMLTLTGSDVPCAIKLFNYQTTLGIAEGIENALFATQYTKCPCWATLNTAFMKKFKAPAGVKHLIIFADNDENGAGLAAAFDCGNKNILANNDVELVTIKWTVERGDFNDLFERESQIFEHTLKARVK
jgi:putative DNA primase/helicase